MGSEIAFWPVPSTSFAFHTDRLPACNPSLLKHDWSLKSIDQSETKTLPIPKSCPLAYRFYIHMQIQYLFMEFTVRLTHLNTSAAHFTNSCCVSLSQSHTDDLRVGSGKGNFSLTCRQQWTQPSPSPTNSVDITDVCFMFQQMLSHQCSLPSVSPLVENGYCLEMRPMLSGCQVSPPPMQHQLIYRVWSQSLLLTKWTDIQSDIPQMTNFLHIWNPTADKDKKNNPKKQ